MWCTASIHIILLIMKDAASMPLIWNILNPSGNIAAFHEFDVYGHIDYVVRYGPEKNKNYSYEQIQRCH